jgi:hypothetical protein
VKYGQASGGGRSSFGGRAGAGAGGFGGANGANGAAGGFARFRGGIATGTVISADAKSITVKQADGSTKTVYFDSTTRVLKSSEATLTDLAKGTTVVVAGTPGSDGSVTARSVQIVPKGANLASFGGAGGMRGGFGGGAAPQGGQGAQGGQGGFGGQPDAGTAPAQ